MLHSEYYTPFGFLNPRFQPVASRESDKRVKPAVDIIESGSQYRLLVELPGIPSSAIELTQEKSRLTIHAEKPVVTTADGEKLTRQERQARVYHREFTLPEDADVSSIEASSDNGVLTLTIARREPESRVRKIEIQS